MRILFVIFGFFENRLFLQIVQNGAPLFYLSWHTDSTPHILLHDCQQLELSLHFFRESTELGALCLQ